MELIQADLVYFVQFILLDEARREPAGKRQTRLLEGFWLRPVYRPLRESDLRERVFTCIEALRVVGKKPVNKAAATVAALHAGRHSDRYVEVIRNAYYEVRRSKAFRMPPSMWFIHFFGWRDWVISSDEFTLAFALSEYRDKFSRARTGRLAQLMNAIRRDPIQIAQNNLWRESQQPGSRSFIPDPANWHLLTRP